MEKSFGAISGFFRQFTGLIRGLAELQGRGDEKSRLQARRRSTRLIVVTIFAGVLGALLMALALVSARQAFPPPAEPGEVAAYEYRPAGTIRTTCLMMFGMSLAALIFARRFVARESSELTESVVVGTRLRVVDQLRKARLFQFEQTKRSEIASALNQSTAIISTSAQSLANGASAALMLICAAAYIAFLSGIAFVLTVACVIAGAIVYSLNFQKLKQQMEDSERLDHRFASLFDHFTDGFKEVKLSHPRSEDLYANFLVPTAQEAGELRKRTAQRHANNAILNEVLLFVLLAVIIFILPQYHPPDAPKVAQVAAVILFIMGPLAELVRTVPIVMMSYAAVTGLYELEAFLGSAADAVRDSAERPPDFQTIRLEKIGFSYLKSSDPQFRLEVPEFDLRAGEMVFLIGGNGSGKSTFLKLLTALYEADEGKILLDGRPVAHRAVGSYRALFSSVFVDYHLFDRLYGLPENVYPRVRQDLEMMEIDHLVTIDDAGRIVDPANKKLDVVSQLSTGQKKRLGLVAALAENRPILVLDEFAADQDPNFRRKFYHELLPAFRARHTILAATHDEHYFQSAKPDRILRFDFGHLEDVTRGFLSPQPPEARS